VSFAPKAPGFELSYSLAAGENNDPNSAYSNGKSQLGAYQS